jgi:hypothetical protein
MTNRGRWIVYRVVFAVVLLALLYGGLRAAPVPDYFFRDEDKVHHALAFLALMVSLRLAWPRQSLALQVAAVIGLGVLIELAQEFMPLRTGALADVAADLVGVVAGLVLLPVVNRVLSR